MLLGRRHPTNPIVWSWIQSQILAWFLAGFFWTWATPYLSFNKQVPTLGGEATEKMPFLEIKLVSKSSSSTLNYGLREGARSSDEEISSRSSR